MVYRASKQYKSHGMAEAFVKTLSVITLHFMSRRILNFRYFDDFNNLAPDKGVMMMAPKDAEELPHN
ncbi:hypothetical protein [Legionella rubrilucens]|uniref:hypothetical protein n=1 Tax=Legionella rubrilucens TaxID=458 RepID=UPI0010551F1F|nr:hypothetical protein [Legionella rubrilucens]